jgi:hypothetical protein
MRLTIVVSIVILVLFSLIIFLKIARLPSKTSEEGSDWIDQDTANSYSEYTGDSLYKIEYDSIVRVKDARSGKLINEFQVYVNRYPQNPEIKQMVPDPTDKYVAFLDGENIVSIYNIFTGECEGSNDYYFDDNHQIFFSDDGKYVLMIDYRDATVDILHCPDLEFIAYTSLGYYRNNFYWENENGKLIFYYEVVDSIFKTIFPEDGHGDSLVFSRPVNLGKILTHN